MTWIPMRKKRSDLKIVISTKGDEKALVELLRKLIKAERGDD